MKRIPTLFMAVILFSVPAFSQKIKLQDITLKDFEPKLYPLDSSANAVILYDGGTANYEGTNDSWFRIIYTYRKRVRLLNKNSFNLATIQIPLYKNGTIEEKITNISATTYYPENGNVSKAEIGKSAVLKDKVSDEYVINKFTFPEIREGCIIDYTYTIESPFPNSLKGWNFQDAYPVLKSEYEVNIPELFNYVFFEGGYYNVSPKVTGTTKSYTILSNNNLPYAPSRVITYTANVVNSKWTLINVPPMVEEKYTTTLRNHIAKIDFQLKSHNFPNEPPKPYMSTWNELITSLLKEEYFGAQLAAKNNWMDDEVNGLMVVGDEIATARNIYRYVADNFTCTDHDAVYLTSNLKNAFKGKKGNVADVNLVLVSMLRKATINADPVLLSTRGNGIAIETYPVLKKFNYVIARAMIGGKQYLLDASVKRAGFNHLPDYCYNGSGRIVNDPPLLVTLSADSLKESKNTAIFIFNDEKEKGKLTGNFNSTLGHFESYDLREKINSNGKEDFFKSLKGSFGPDAEITNSNIDSLSKYDERAGVNFEFSFSMDEDIVYFSPLFSEAYKTNPFTAAKRLYPVEMPYASDELITISMEIPAGYVIDEMPKSVRVNLNDNEGMFEYIINADATNINLRCKLKINRANFSPEDYETLRDFYGQVVKKQNEQIVFKKKK